MARKQNYSFFGREVDVVWWSVAAKPYLKTCSHIQQQCGSSAVEFSYICITEKHGWSTVENYCHAGLWPHCRKLVELHKAKAASHTAWSSVKCDKGTDVIVKGTWHAD